jgi:hypothetical protein
VVNGKTGVVLRPEPVKASAPMKPGLLRVAADALNRANKEMMKIDPNSTWACSPPVDAIEALIEATSAIVHELDASKDDGADADRVVQKVIADGVSAVKAEREQCARVAEQSPYVGGGKIAALIRDRVTS